MNVRIANTNVRTNTGKPGCVGSPLRESWSYNICSVSIYTLRIVSDEPGTTRIRDALQGNRVGFNEIYRFSSGNPITLHNSLSIPGTDDAGYPGPPP